MKRLSLIALLGLVFSSSAYAYPNGTPMYVTDAAPFCASCHSASRAEYMPELPPEAAKRELIEAKHFGLIRTPMMPSPYIELTDEQKEKLIRDIKTIDSNASVTIKAPEGAKAGGEVTVSVKVRGGNGPVVGVMLVDRALRFQARPVSSDGWTLTKEPEVTGQDGKAQTSWLDKRVKGARRNLSYVNIDGQRFDPEKNIYPEGTVAYTLKAPSMPGDYTLAAAFLYGTENTDRAGFFQRPSGRILFSDEVKVRVE